MKMLYIIYNVGWDVTFGFTVVVNLCRIEMYRTVCRKNFKLFPFLQKAHATNATDHI